MFFTSYRISVYFIAISGSHFNPDVKLIYFHLFSFICISFTFIFIYGVQSDHSSLHIIYSHLFSFTFIQTIVHFIYGLRTNINYHLFIIYSHLFSFTFIRTIVHFIYGLRTNINYHLFRMIRDMVFSQIIVPWCGNLI